jgi:hypothetical protein
MSDRQMESPIMTHECWKLEQDGGWFVTKDGSATLSEKGRKEWVRCMLEAVKRQWIRLQAQLHECQP